jgi:hypothetical protein
MMMKTYIIIEMFVQEVGYNLVSECERHTAVTVSPTFNISCAGDEYGEAYFTVVE